MTAYWPNNTDWGVERRYFVREDDGRFAVEDADSDVGTPPVAVFADRRSAAALCRRLNNAI